MKLIVDENIAFAKEAFSHFGEVNLMPGRSIKNEDLLEAEILIVRSVTNVNKELLDGTAVKFVGTATIGTDHLDEEYLKEHSIFYTSAAGCNSYAVAEYVFSAIIHLAYFNNLELKNKSIGIIGKGNIGSKVVKMAEALGLEILVNDPPLQRETGSKEFCSLEEALSADIITFHVPLNLEGEDKTLHLLNENNIGLIKPGSVLINSSRGPVVDNKTLLARIKKSNDIFTVFDVWENEPKLDKEFLGLVNIATPHIAGYSLEGKVNGTKMIYDKLCEHQNETPNWEPELPKIKSPVIELNFEKSIEYMFHKIFNHVYPISEDNSKLKKALSLATNEIPAYFDKLRKDYPLRRELDKYSIKFSKPNSNLNNLMRALRLSLLQ